MRKKRQRHVFTSGEIPHLWAHRTQDDARNQKGSLYFTGDTIYSYGSHFPIARQVTNETGERAILFTTETRSVTTSIHCSAVRSAIPSGLVVFHVPTVCHSRYSESDLTVEDHSSNVADYAKRIEKHIITSARARSSYVKQWNHEQAGRLLDEALRYSGFFRLPTPNLPTVPALDSEALTAIRKREARRCSRKSRGDQTQTRRSHRSPARTN